VCAERDAPASAFCERGWSAFRFEGPIPFETTGVVSSLSAPLAAAGVAVFVLSTYDTDVVLVKSAEAARAQAALQASGFSFAEPR
jgi:hypothetical protein